MYERCEDNRSLGLTSAGDTEARDGRRTLDIRRQVVADCETSDGLGTRESDLKVRLRRWELPRRALYPLVSALTRRHDRRIDDSRIQGTWPA